MFADTKHMSEWLSKKWERASASSSREQLQQEDNDISFIEQATTALVYKQTHNVATSFCSPKEAKLRQWTEWRTRVRLLLARRRVHCHLESVGVYVAAAAMAFLPKTIWFATVDDSQQVHAQAHTHTGTITFIRSVSLLLQLNACQCAAW